MIVASMNCCRRALAAVWSLPATMALAVALCAFSLPAASHKASDSYLQLRAQGQGIELRWDIALRDLDNVVEIDANGDAQITWGEIKAAWPAIEAHLLQRIAIDGCPLQPVRRGLEQRSDGAYAVLWLHAECALTAEPVVSYSLFRETDPTHRGLLKIELAGQALVLRVLDPTRERAPASAIGIAATQTPVDALPAAPREAQQHIALAAAVASAVGSPAAAQTPSFLGEGVHHIVTGYDHVLFLLCLLLPAVMRRTPQGWQPVGRLPEAVLPVVGIVSAFTLAHSITLTLAALKLVSLPSWFIEPAIAVTIVLTALDNLWPIFRLPRAAVAFCFGLVHGFGFASVLAELDLPASSFAWALLQFNLGLELGQLCIVFAVTAGFYALRRSSRYPRWVIQGGSLAAMAVGALWFVERTADVSLLPL
jgi:hypothetical protein